MTDRDLTDRDVTDRDGTERPPPLRDEALRTVVGEIEAHVAESGWDQPGRLYALVDTAQLLTREPGLSSVLGLDAAAEGLTAVEQEGLPPGSLEEALLAIEWPPDVAGCAAVVERYVLPPEAEATMPASDAQAQQYAAAHPDRQEVRIVAGVTRAGTTHCALRLRSHDDALSVVDAPDLVPTLLELLARTLEDGSVHPTGDEVM